MNEKQLHNIRFEPAEKPENNHNKIQKESND